MRTTKITERALVQRINRKLAHDHKRLSYGTNPWCSGEKCWSILDTYRNTYETTVADLVEFARAVGCVAPNERLSR